MGHNDDRAAGAGGELAKQLHHRACGLGIERCGGLVADDDRWIATERASDRDALLLTTREVRGQAVHARAEADALEQLLCLLLCLLLRLRLRPARLRILHLDRHRDVLERRQGREQVEALEDEAKVASAEGGEGALAEAGDVLALDPHLAGGRRQQ